MKNALLILLGSALILTVVMEKEPCTPLPTVSTAHADVSPQNIVFKLLAVENRLGNMTTHFAQDFIKSLTSFANWRNGSTSNGFQYTSYVHLLSEADLNEIDKECQTFYKGKTTKANLLNETTSFLCGALPENTLSVRILYYSGNAEKTITGNNTQFCLALDEMVYDWELNQTLSNNEPDDTSTTLLAFDSRYSGGFITRLAQPGRVILTACTPLQNAEASSAGPTMLSWFTGAESAAYPNGTNFGPLGLIGGITAGEDLNHDGWRSADEIFRFASSTATWYAANQTDLEHETGYTQNPWAYFGNAGGEIPVVQTDTNAEFPIWGKNLSTLQSSPDPYHSDKENLQHRMFRYSPSHLGISQANGPTSPSLLWKSYLSDSISSSVAVADGMVLVGTVGGRFYALEMATGQVIWSFFVGSPIYSSPAVQNGIVVFGSAEPGRIYALDQYSGTVRWMYEIPSGQAVLSSPTIENNKVFITSSDAYLRAFDLFGGSLIKELHVGGDVQSSPAIAEGKIFALGNSVNAFDEQNGTVLWTFHTDWPIFFSSAAVYDGVVYVGAGNDDSVYALNATTGIQIWRFKTGGWFSSPAVDADANIVVAGCRDARIYCLDKKYGLLKWEYLTENSNHMSSPTISANGLVYVGSLDSRLYCLNKSTGAQVWNYLTGNAITSAPVVISEHVLVGSNDGYLYCLGPPFPEHDVAVTNGTISKETAKQGDLVEVSCTLKNLGNVRETVAVEWTHNTTEVWLTPDFSEPKTIHYETINMQPEATITLTWTWNTSETQNGEHSIILRADLVTDETKATNNAFFAGSLLLWPQTDLDSNGAVDIVDMAIVARSYRTRPGDPRWNPTVDFDANSLIDIIDIATVARDFGKTF
jgi:outer membrane protein assembly factor BamB